MGHYHLTIRVQISAISFSSPEKFSHVSVDKSRVKMKHPLPKGCKEEKGQKNKCILGNALNG